MIYSREELIEKLLISKKEGFTYMGICKKTGLKSRHISEFIHKEIPNWNVFMTLNNYFIKEKK